MNSVAADRVAIVVQRYGPSINGGAEVHARRLAEALRSYYEIEILTSCALEDSSWDMHFPEGQQEVDGYVVHRFRHPARTRSSLRRLPLAPRLRFIFRKLLERLNALPLVLPPSTANDQHTLRWLEAQGPHVASLISYLEKNPTRYSAVIFFTALFYPTAIGISAVPTRAILVPTLHDEKSMYRSYFHRVFRYPRWIMYNSRAEMNLAHRLYGNNISPGQVCGVGIEVTPPEDSMVVRSLNKYGLTTPYFIYVGRINKAKGCAQLFEDFLLFSRKSEKPVKLVVVGRASMPLPKEDCFVFTDFIDDEIKNALIKGAIALVIPSRFESLSLVLLESLALSTPVIVNACCEVLADHVVDSKAGRSYSNRSEFLLVLQELLEMQEVDRKYLIDCGRAYVETNYSWPVVIEKYRRVMEKMIAS
ncbi:MAG: glycosyltransferase [Burkholderiaceae bacterium]